MHTVDAEGRYDGLTLREALPFVVREIVDAFDPVELVVFGSVARGEEGPDSDLDLLVVFDRADVIACFHAQQAAEKALKAARRRVDAVS